ncbi:hypothetical protein ACHAXA_005371 [Cyclostephanos tholiformis]|uniref:CHCH domain-containing protein n=1 Tax=Cyclostephanos tholiformis TaxID=382380 RepID=A0ABD3RD71_9STRA
MGQTQSATSAPSSPPPSVSEMPPVASAVASVAKEEEEEDDSKIATSAIIDEGRPDDPSSSDDGIVPASHNFGRPMNDKTGGASRLVTDCRAQQRASLACIEENYRNKDMACADFFDAYKKCRREEHERKLDANARASAW